MKYLTIFTIAVFILTSCNIKDVEVGKIESVSIKELTKEHISLELMVPVKNNNDFSFTISDVNLDLSLNNVALGKVNKTSKLKIPANSNSVHPFEVEIKFSKLADNPLSLFSSLISNKIGLKAKGYIKARKFLIWKKYPIDENQSVKLFKKGIFN
jgi:LEA14-like dessication related protein